jgi:hypothetical protein
LSISWIFSPSDFFSTATFDVFEDSPSDTIASFWSLEEELSFITARVVVVVL